jgi:5'-nucleotidase/UDP-sugar diphosphatase
MDYRQMRGMVVTLSAAVLLAGCSMMPGYQSDATFAPDKEYKLTILHTNDHHGRFWQNSNGEYGMAARKTLIDGIRAEVAADGGSVLLLSGGDINTGVPESDMQDAEPDFKGMAAIGYDAMAIGNHEFDNARDVLMQQQEWAGFSFLSANIYRRDNGMTLFPAYKVFDVDGMKVVVVGFTTEDTVKIGNPEYTSDLEFRSPVTVATELMPALQKRGALVIAATHMGHYADANHGGNAPGDVTLARSVSGFDVIVGGHSQVALSEPDVQNGALIVQAHEWGKYVGRLDLVVKNGDIISSNYRLIPINLKNKGKDAEGNSVYTLIEDEIAEDADMLAMLTPYQEAGAESLNTVIGTCTGNFVGERSQVRSSETNLGNLIAEAQRVKAGADVAIMNSGGIRADMACGDITYKHVLTVQPFANILTYVELTGAELFDYLTVVASKEAGSGAFAQSAGVTMDVKAGMISKVMIGGKALDKAATYRLAINSFMASGGDGYTKVSDHPNFVNTGFVDADLLVDYIQRNSPMSSDDFAPTGAINRM